MGWIYLFGNPPQLRDQPLPAEFALRVDYIHGRVLQRRNDILENLENIRHKRGPA